ncbi:MAG: hypothetical protein QOG75_5410 [Mycobacterium sp.]|jgi:hypothetical protein|nr:hypothetical protein [Mycobacterium sp.]
MADGSGKMSRGAVVGVDSYMMSGAETDRSNSQDLWIGVSGDLLITC